MNSVIESGARKPDSAPDDWRYLIPVVPTHVFVWDLNGSRAMTRVASPASIRPTLDDVYEHLRRLALLTPLGPCPAKPQDETFPSCGNSQRLSTSSSIGRYSATLSAGENQKAHPRIVCRLETQKIVDSVPRPAWHLPHAMTRWLSTRSAAKVKSAANCRCSEPRPVSKGRFTQCDSSLARPDRIHGGTGVEPAAKPTQHEAMRLLPDGETHQYCKVSGPQSCDVFLRGMTSSACSWRVVDVDRRMCLRGVMQGRMLCRSLCSRCEISMCLNTPPHSTTDAQQTGSELGLEDSDIARRTL
nr:hypothetical protein CFP56_74976 [Quercus suber]